MYVNTDRDTSTGCAGSEYRIYAFGSPLAFGVDPCGNGTFAEGGACCGSFSNEGLAFTILPEKLGGSTRFWYWIATAVNGNFGPPAGDFVPDVDPSGSPIQYDGGAFLTVTKSGSGTVTSSPGGIQCGSALHGELLLGRDCPANCPAGCRNEFAGWSGDCSGKSKCALTMDANHATAAEFVKAGPKRMSVVVPLLKRSLLTGGNLTWWRRFAVWRLPPQTKVVFHCCGHTEVAHANARGKARSRLVPSHKSAAARQSTRL